MDEVFAMTDRWDATVMIALATVLGYCIGRFNPGEGCLLVVFPLVMIDIVATVIVTDPNFGSASFRSVTGAWLAYFAGCGFRAHALRAAKRKNQEPPHHQHSPT